jgi:thioredoxin-related protein
MTAFLVAGVMSLAAASARAETILIMAEETGCMWCALWNKQIAPIYPKTVEGRTAPLRRINIRDEPPTDIVFKRRLTYTPTFVLVNEGQEVSRIEGYPGEDFFWGLLGQMLKEAGIAHERSG